MTRRRVAARPKPRTIEVELNGESEFPGWWCTARVDFPARLVADLNSGDLDRMLGALSVVIVDWNFPDEKGGRAATLKDVDPYTGLIAVAGVVFPAITKLPNR